MELIPLDKQLEYMQVVGKKLAHRLNENYWTPWFKIGDILTIRAQVLPTRGSYNYWPIEMKQEDKLMTIRYPQFFGLMQWLGRWYRDEQPDTCYTCTHEKNVLYLDGKDKQCYVTKGKVTFEFNQSFCKGLWTGCTSDCQGCVNCRLTKFAETYLHIVQGDWEHYE